MLEKNLKVFSANPVLGPRFGVVFKPRSIEKKMYKKTQNDSFCRCLCIVRNWQAVGRTCFGQNRGSHFGQESVLPNDHFLVQIYTREDDGNLCNLRCSEPCGSILVYILTLLINSIPTHFSSKQDMIPINLWKCKMFLCISVVFCLAIDIHHFYFMVIKIIGLRSHIVPFVWTFTNPKFVCETWKVIAHLLCFKGGLQKFTFLMNKSTLKSHWKRAQATEEG